ncbi:methyltransferase-like protein 4 [Sitophilus oryzae]|uniref:Methyltransferase-like protein 4 n=1 Tax=Sitophilus oryzae TaxID=7048 RepID=A0A6J2YCI3_SITOR|nr:methyltransferase-like protein 4 [Sitophilus oryzae]
MALKIENEDGFLIDTKTYFNSILPKNGCVSGINENLFKIFTPYSTKNISKRKKSLKKQDNETKQNENESIYCDFKSEVQTVKEKYLKFTSYLRKRGFFQEREAVQIKNILALETAEKVYFESGKNIIKDTTGCNYGPATVQTLDSSKFLFPENCKFYSKDISNIETHLKDTKFDVILLDPPWWNKYIRRKRKKSSEAYNMMYNTDLETIPIENLLKDDGLVVVWCTNSLQHLNYLTENIFQKWGVKYVSKWYWVKVTMSGEPVCKFSEPPGKQPFEQIIFACKNPEKNPIPESGKLLISIPSAIHSHKPPLIDVIRPYMQENATCLEIFARYLLPEWTSYGNEVLRFQHESLYDFKQ